jgi:hypothetical protein
VTGGTSLLDFLVSDFCISSNASIRMRSPGFTTGTIINGIRNLAHSGIWWKAGETIVASRGGEQLFTIHEDVQCVGDVEGEDVNSRGKT